MQKQIHVAFPWVVTSTGPGGFMVVCEVYDRNSRRLNRKHWLSQVAHKGRALSEYIGQVIDNLKT